MDWGAYQASRTEAGVQITRRGCGGSPDHAANRTAEKHPKQKGLP